MVLILDSELNIDQISIRVAEERKGVKKEMNYLKKPERWLHLSSAYR